MASCSRRKLEADARRDVISELPAELKERILECLPIRDAARAALLPTQWKDAWLRLGRLVFDSNFFMSVRESKGYSVVPFVKIITYILLQRVRPVKKFNLFINYLSFDPNLELSDVNRWFLFLSRNGVEELYIWHSVPREYKLPFCIVSCPTIKQLRLHCLDFDCPRNAPTIFPCVTSLEFSYVVFNSKAKGIVPSIPNLEKLDFYCCGRISKFKISAPKLERLSVIGNLPRFKLRWTAHHLEAIKVLCLDHTSLLLWEVASSPTAINLQVIKLDFIKFANEKQLIGVLQLLQKSPNLCELDITAATGSEGHIECDELEAVLRLLKDPDRCIINQDLKLLKTIKIESFGGSTAEMLFVKMLLLKSPTLERLLIPESDYVKDASNVIQIQRELSSFPRASPKAQIICMGKDYAA